MHELLTATLNGEITSMPTRRPPALDLRLTANSTIESTNPPWLASAERRINSLLSLHPNWDGEGAPTINFECAMSVMHFLLSSCIKNETPEPQLVPTSVGGLQVEWHIGDIDLEIRFGPAEPVTYFYFGPKAVEIEGEVYRDALLVNSLLRELPVRNDFRQPTR